MKCFGIFMIFVCLAVANGESAVGKSQQDSKSAHQDKKATSLQAASTHDQKVQIVHSQEFRTNKIENSNNLDKPSRHFQLQNAQFVNQDQPSLLHSLNQDPQQPHSQSLEEQLRNQHRASSKQNQGVQSYTLMHQAQHNQFDEQEQSQNLNRNRGHQDFLQNQAGQNREQTMSGGSPYSHDEAASSTYGRHGSQHTSFPTPRIHDQTASRTYVTHDSQHTPVPISRIDEQANGVSPGQQLYTSTLSNQEGFYKGSMSRDQDQRILTSAGQHGSIFGRPVESRVSAFERGAQAIHLPRISHHHASSVVVSGLKNLPSLPALVYSSGAMAIPSDAPVFAYSRPWHQGGAYVRQHWQTPHARYVFSHIL